MTCPLCGAVGSKVLRTIPGLVVSRQHECTLCTGRWWSDQQLRVGTVQASRVLPVAQGKDRQLPSSPELELIRPDSDPNPKASLLPKRAPAREADLGPVVFTFPVSGDPANPTWSIRQQQHEKLQKAYSQINVLAEYDKVDAYLAGNPKKTARGMMAFLFRWMGKAQNGLRGQGQAPASFAVRQERERTAHSISERAKSAFGVGR